MGFQAGISTRRDGGRDRGPKGWWLAANGVVALVGLILAGYASYHHRIFKAQGATDFSCNINAAISCDSIAASPYSEFWGLPVADYGVAYYLVLLLVLGALRFPIRKGPQGKDASVVVYGLLIAVGAVVSLVLGTISLGILKVICVVCLGLYLVNAILVGLAIKESRFLRGTWSMRGALLAAFESIFLVGIILGGLELVYSPKTVLGPSAPSKTEETTHGGTTQAPGSEAQQAINNSLAPQTREIPISLSPYTGLGEDYRLGDDERAKVTLVAFSDFECPACQTMSSLMHDLREEFGDNLRIVFRNYPLDQSCNASISRPMHQMACKIAVLARCAGQQEKFWQFHDRAFMNQSAPDKNPEEWAHSVGLAAEEVAICLQSESILSKIKDDIALGNALGVESTPTVFINNRKFVGARKDLAGLIRRLIALE